MNIRMRDDKSNNVTLLTTRAEHYSSSDNINTNPIMLLGFHYGSLDSLIKDKILFYQTFVSSKSF